MRERIPAELRDGNLQVGNRTRSQAGALPDARKRHIIDRLRRGLIHDMGYNFTYDMQYGINYG